MPYLIDGHNLIPKLGLRLDSPDDEMELAAILQEFARLERKQVEVYFDGAPAGHSGTRSLGTVKAHFIPLSHTADQAIRMRLKKMRKDAKNWIVVSSDRQVQADERGAGTQAVSSDEFVVMLKQARVSAPKPDTSERKLSPTEVNEWLELFKSRNQ